MSWQERIKSWLLTFAKTKRKPEFASRIRRLQFLRAGCILLLIFCTLYGIVFFLFKGTPEGKKEEASLSTPTLIETPSAKIGTDEVWRYKMEEENKKLRAEITSLKTLVQPNVKDGETSSQSSSQDVDAKILEFETRFEERLQEFQRGLSSSEPSQMESPQMGPSQMGPSSPLFQSSQDDSGQEEPLIQKFTLSLAESRKRLKTVDTTIPAGAFAKTVLLSGLDASSAMNASSDPRPMLLRLIDPGTLPRRFQSDLKDCHCLASAYGDLSSERIYARLEKLTCIERATGEIIETQVAGYIAGADGKAGIRGIVASKDGQFLGRSLVGGIFSGLSNVANPQNRQGFMNPFSPGNAHISPPSIGETFTSGMASGVTTALDRLSQYYIDRAEQLQPIIQVSAGQVVDIVFTEGTFIGSQNVKAEIEKTRNKNQESSSCNEKGECQ